MFGVLKPRVAVLGAEVAGIVEATGPGATTFQPGDQDLGYVNDLFEAHGLECVIDGPYPLSTVPQALRRFGEAKHIGKIVITVTS